MQQKGQIKSKARLVVSMLYLIGYRYAIKQAARRHWLAPFSLKIKLRRHERTDSGQ